MWSMYSLQSSFSLSLPFSKTVFLALGNKNANPIFDAKCVIINGIAEKKEAITPNPKNNPDEIFMVSSKNNVAMAIIPIHLT